eukprot:6667444-Ditylum_brightwellii.AAC.1
MALLSGVDAKNMPQNINTTHLTDRVLAAAMSYPHSPTLMKTLMGEHGEEFRAAMVKEINAFKNRKIWTLIPKSNLPESIKVIPTTWGMKIK